MGRSNDCEAFFASPGKSGAFIFKDFESGKENSLLTIT